MRTKITTFLSVLMMVFVVGCTVTEKSQRNPKLSAQAGLNRGGITENTDLSLLPSAASNPAATVDAFSGATRMGFNTGLHINQPLPLGEIETGVDYMYNRQRFTFADATNFYIGIRNFHVNQLMMPLTYNIVLFKQSLPYSEIQLKFGFMGQINLIGVSDIATTTLPDYSIKTWSSGATFGLSAYPFRFDNGNKLGFYLDAYRGSRIYTDFYNQEGFEMPGSSFIKIGLRYQWKTFDK